MLQDLLAAGGITLFGGLLLIAALGKPIDAADALAVPLVFFLGLGIAIEGMAQVGALLGWF